MHSSECHSRFFLLLYAALFIATNNRASMYWRGFRWRHYIGDSAKSSRCGATHSQRVWRHRWWRHSCWWRRTSRNDERHYRPSDSTSTSHPPGSSSLLRFYNGPTSLFPQTTRTSITGTYTSPKCRLSAEQFRTQEVFNILKLKTFILLSISIQKETNVVVFYFSVTYFQLKFQLSVCFYTMPDQTSTTNFRTCDRKLSSTSK